MIVSKQRLKSTIKTDHFVRRINRLRFRHFYREASEAAIYRQGFLAGLDARSACIERDRLRPDYGAAMNDLCQGGGS